MALCFDIAKVPSLLNISLEMDFQDPKLELKMEKQNTSGPEYAYMNEYSLLWENFQRTY